MNAAMHIVADWNVNRGATVGATHETLKTAIDCRAGSERAIARLPQEFLLYERHHGGHCPRCGTALATIKRAGRTSYYCPHCQPK